MVSFLKAKIVDSNELPESRFFLDIRHLLSFPELQVGILTIHSTLNQRLSHGEQPQTVYAQLLTGVSLPCWELKTSSIESQIHREMGTESCGS